jgi:hypothetical protein
VLRAIENELAEEAGFGLVEALGVEGFFHEEGILSPAILS